MAEYISRNEAINAIKSLESSMPAKDNYAKGYDAALGRVLVAVRAVPPAADVQPVCHGRWEYIRNVKLNGTIKLCECNICHNKIFGGLSYCGNCGARMDLKDGDTNG